MTLVLSACDKQPHETAKSLPSDHEAQYQLAQDYLTTGKGKNNTGEAIQILNQLANKDYTLAQNKLGYLYSQGKVLEKDLIQAYHWYGKAAEAGFAISQYNLAEMQRFGLGIQENKKSAFNWYQKSALQGYPNAMFRLAEAYSTGEGVEKDLGQAYAWYRMTIDNGLNLPERIPNRIASNLTEGQLAQANTLIDELKWKISVSE